MDGETVFDKVQAGYYRQMIGVDLRPPKMPAFLSKPASQLPYDILAKLPEIKKQYEAELKAHEEVRNKYRQRQEELDTEFVRDVNEHFGLSVNDPFVQKMHGLAYERGHAGGDSDILSNFSDLMGLYECHKNTIEMTEKQTKQCVEDKFRQYAPEARVIAKPKSQVNTPSHEFPAALVGVRLTSQGLLFTVRDTDGMCWDLDIDEFRLA